MSEKKNLERVSNFLGNCNIVVYLLFTRIGRYIPEELLERQPVRCLARKIRSGIYERNARHGSNGESFKMVDAGNLFAPHVALRGRRSGSVRARDPGTSTNLLSFPSLPPFLYRWTHPSYALGCNYILNSIKTAKHGLGRHDRYEAARKKEKPTSA